MLLDACPFCGGANLRVGRLRGPVWFETMDQEYYWCSDEIPVHALVCLSCGHIEMMGDVQLARQPAMTETMSRFAGTWTWRGERQTVH